MDQLNQTIQQELAMHEALRIKSLELEATNRKLNELAIHDGLTGAFRRGYIEGELRRMVKGAWRKPSDFSVMLLDIDLFKRVNDQHGHAVGDDVLRSLTKLVQETLRENDLFGRWGGEEFIVLMPDTGLRSAVEAAERVRKAVHSMRLASAQGPFGVTVSIGVAQLEPEEAADRLTHRVDKALYAAKHGGRDRVQPYAPEQE
jgi:diguanylate cyclase (GGDEF)-like protein